jgi:GT2 family glycosyltransferase
MLRLASTSLDAFRMSQVETRSHTSSRIADRIRPPSVLVVLVVKDGAEWLPHCLRGLSRQTHPRIGVLAVDNGSTDDSRDLLQTALGDGRVLQLGGNLGFGTAVAQALATRMAAEADYVLLLHDDTVLAPDAVAGLVDAAERIEGVGVVGPKVLDWMEPATLRDIGLSTDQFGYPYSPLEDDEIDQGQYDRIREVLFVSSCAMLVSKKAWARIGPPDERFPSGAEELDYCWRARVAGFRVLMTPRAVAHHRGASRRNERAGIQWPRPRYERERIALASMLKNYGLLSLLWLLPLYAVQASVRMAMLILSRRLEDAYQVAAAWGWNLSHLPGTLSRRVRVQASRIVSDRSVRGTMAPAWIRLRGWALSAGQSLLPEREAEPAEGAAPAPFRTRVAGFAAAHPVATAWVVGIVVAMLAYRRLLLASPLLGGALRIPPPSPSGFFRELVSGLRHTGLGGSQAASPALGILGIGSVVTFASPALLQKALLLGLPPVAAVGCYRAVRSVVDERVPAVVSALVYGFSGVVMWGVSEGRIPLLVFLAGLPWLATKLSLPFDLEPPLEHRRWVVGAAVGFAVLTSFFAGTVLAAGVLIAAFAIWPLRGANRMRGIVLALTAAAAAAALIFPLALALARAGGPGLWDSAGRPSFSSVMRLHLGPGPGSWWTGLYLPLAAALSLVFVSGRRSGVAMRAATIAIVSVYLAWLAGAGYLPLWLSNPAAYAGLAAFSLSLLVGLGVGFVTRGMGELPFGYRQVGTGLMVLLLGVGITGQALQAAKGSWAVGGADRIPAAYPLISDTGGPPFRVLWVGSLESDGFAAPAGGPDGTVDAGLASVRFAVRSPSGASALDIGRPAAGPGYDYLRRVLGETMAGKTRHAGSMLAPLSVRFVVADPRDIPLPALRRLGRQLDLNRVPAGELIIMENSKWVPLVSVIPDREWLDRAFSPDVLSVSQLSAPHPEPLGPGRASSTRSAEALVLITQQYDPRWRLTVEGAAPLKPRKAFGWAVGFVGRPRPSGFAVAFGGQQVRNLEIALLALLWLGALWLIRKPARIG